MPLQNPSHLSLCVQVVPMNGDLFAPQKASPSLQSRIFETGSQTTMPSLVDHAANTISDYCYHVKPYHENESLPLKSLPWRDVPELSPFKQEINHYGLTHESSETHFENAFGGPYTEKPVEDPPWDYGYIHHSVPPYTSSISPRSYPTESDVNMRESMQPHTETHTMPSFLTDSPQHVSHQPMIATLRLQRHRDVLTNPSNLCQIQLGEEHFQNPCPTPSLYSADPTNFDLSPTSSPSTGSPSTVVGQEVSNDRAAFNGEESDEDGGSNSEPYAQLIFRALKSAPAHRMVLKEIYEWFVKNTDKAKTSSSKGWQNSIRHNLSMNGAFKKVDQAPPAEEAKKGFIWVLEPTAVEEGVKSTTRYRKFNSNRKIGKGDQPAPQRQRSGAKGGKAAKKAAKTRRSARFGAPSKLRYVETPSAMSPAVSVSTTENVTQVIPEPGLGHSTAIPYYLSTPTSSSQTSVLDSKSYGYEDIMGCSSHICDPLFYEGPDRGNDSILSYPLFSDSGDNVFNYGLAA